MLCHFSTLIHCMKNLTIQKRFQSDSFWSDSPFPDSEQKRCNTTGEECPYQIKIGLLLLSALRDSECNLVLKSSCSQSVKLHLVSHFLPWPSPSKLKARYIIDTLRGTELPADPTISCILPSLESQVKRLNTCLWLQQATGIIMICQTLLQLCLSGHKIGQKLIFLVLGA